MSRAPVLVALLLLGASGPAPSQEAPKPPAKEERPSLNLRLDNAARYTRESPDGKAAADNLPSLGGNAAPLERTPKPVTYPGASPFPKDTEPGR